MAKYLLCVSTNANTALAVNAMEWDGVSLYTPPPGQTPVAVVGSEWIGWTSTKDGQGNMTWQEPVPSATLGTQPEGEL